MMSHDKPGGKPATKEENKSSGNRKITGSTSQLQDQQAALKCPRCDSPNTKFCYYNNYSLSQPRHFCRACRRYWTKGGALRNVPIGGCCRKNKKLRSSSRIPSDSTSEMGGLKLFHGLSPPAMDFKLGGLSFPRLNPSPAAGIYNQFASFGDNTTSPSFSHDPAGCSSSLMGFHNYPLSSVTSGLSGAIQEMGSLNVSSGLACSIESLSSMNQDLHWKLQQQRLAMLFTGENQRENSATVSSVPVEISQAEKLQPILFQNLEISKPEISAAGNQSKETSYETAATEWFFGNSYAPVTPTPTTSSNGIGNDNTTTSNWNAVQAWNDLHHYNTLP